MTGFKFFAILVCKNSLVVLEFKQVVFCFFANAMHFYNVMKMHFYNFLHELMNKMAF